MKHGSLAVFALALLLAAVMSAGVVGGSHLFAADAKAAPKQAPKKDDKKKVPAAKWRDAADPLHVAAFEGDLAAMKKLLAAKAVNVNVPLEFRTFPGYTPLHMAALEGQSKVVEMLVAKKADLNLTEKQNKRTALHLAAANGHVAVVRALIKGGADLNLKDKFKNTALGLASEKGVIAELTKAGAAKE